MRQPYNSARWVAQIAAPCRFFVPCLFFMQCLLFTGSEAAFAARPLPRFDVSVDGKPALRAFGGRRGDNADGLWLSLKQARFEQATGPRKFPPYRVEADQDDPLRATLKGSIVIAVEEGGRADVSELRLIRENENAHWVIAPEDVDRTLKNRHKPFVIVVSIDGTSELSTGIVTRTGKTLDNPENVWQSLKRLNMIPIRGQKFQPETDDPSHATLSGNVVIELTYDKHLWGRAEVSALRLVRQNGKAWKWQVDPADVDRTFNSRTVRQPSRPAP